MPRLTKPLSKCITPGTASSPFLRSPHVISGHHLTQRRLFPQEENIALQEKTARALKQKDVIDAKLAINIKEDLAEAARKEAEGIRDYTKFTADGNAYAQEKVGEGTAKAYEAQAEAIGKNNLAIIKLLESIATGNVKIVPDFLIQGGDNQSGNLFSAWLATMVKDQVEKKKEENKGV